MVLARRWRPRTFSELVGQEHVQRALINALDEDRLHHAFLFTGTRGVGKTTIARILAKCLNCDKGVRSVPCGECSACEEIDSGRFVDLIEVDAASRTKVDDTRELLENVQYAPTRGRYKVYLIDEVHMLSTHSFNALLKTLEEPPPHVKFLLATTDPQKLPVTVLSRCLQFNLKRLPLVLIQGQLEKILAADKIKAEPVALELLSRAADGSMRDALSLLDQAISYGGGEVSEAEVRGMLGTIDKRHIYALLGCLAKGDIQGALEVVAKLDERAPDYEAALGDLAEVLHKLALRQVATLPDDDSAGGAELNRLASQLGADTIQLYYQIAITGRRDLPLAPDPRGGFEMVMLRMHAFEPTTTDSNSSEPAPAASRPKRAPTPKPAKAKKTAAVAETPGPGSPVSAANKSGGDWPGMSWRELITELPVQGAARQLLVNCGLRSREGAVVNLVLAPGNEHLLTDKLQRRLQDAMSKHCGEPLKLRVVQGEPDEETLAEEQQRKQSERQADAETAIDQDPNVEALRQAFDARVQPESVKPTELDQ